MELAASRDYRDRADAGRAMASFADVPEARGPLVRLVLDRDDTFVTRATAEALLRRRDSAGVAAVAGGSAGAAMLGNLPPSPRRPAPVVAGRDADTVLAAFQPRSRRG